MNESIEIRDLHENDFERGFLELLSQLTSTDKISKNEFTKQLKTIAGNQNHVVRVIVFKESQRIIATGTLFVEPKFIHHCGKVGHIEDIVVDQEVRGHHLGLKIIEDLTRISVEKGSYKTILNCARENTGFYEKCGYEIKEVEMVKYHQK